MITVKLSSETRRENQFYKSIARDLKQVLLLMLSERGHGKSSSLKTIIQRIKQSHPEIVYKCFDVSLSWFNKSPLTYRQYVTLSKWNSNQIANVNDCVYELGDLPPELRRLFVATIINQDYQKARQATLKGEKTPFICYIVEEANTIFNSYSFRKNDQASAILQDFVSVGRNIGGGMGAILVSTAEVGELAPSIRRRRRIIYGRIESPSDIAEARRHSKTLAEQLKQQPRYTFTYEGMTQKIPDTCNTTPTDYIVQTPPTTEIKTTSSGWLTQFLGTIAIFLLFWSFLMQI